MPPHLCRCVPLSLASGVAPRVSSGPQWVHEIKHDGYRIIACKSGETVRLWSRNGWDWSKEFLAVTEALRALRVDDIAIDGQAMAHCKDGLPDFFGLRSEDGGASACLFAFDLLRLNGTDLRPLPLEERRARLPKVLRGSGEALRFSEHLEGDGDAIFRHACALRLEGIVSMRRDARYRSGRSLTWLKVKNPAYERPRPAFSGDWVSWPLSEDRQHSGKDAPDQPTTRKKCENRNVSAFPKKATSFSVLKR